MKTLSEEQREFCTLLDNQPETPGDIAFIMRNLDPAICVWRVHKGMELVIEGKVPIMCMVNRKNTYGEVTEAIFRAGYQAAILEWKTLLIVTCVSHSYRAFLTFLKGVQVSGLPITLVNAPWDRWADGNINGASKDTAQWDQRRWDLYSGEFDRIERYQKLGYVASYREGIDYLLRSQCP